MAKAKYQKNSRGEYEAKIWDGTYNKDGSKHRKRIATKKSSAELERLVDDFKKKVSNADVVTFSDVTFTEYANEWLNISKTAREKNTRIAYQNVINVHLSFLSDIPLTEVTHSHFQQAINNQIDHPPTCEKIYITFRQIIKNAIRDKILPKGSFDDICEDIALPKMIKKEKRPLTANEKAAFRKALTILDDRKRAFLLLLYYCGLRRGEALALTKDDFDFVNQELKITNAIIFPAEKGEIKPYPKSDNGIRTIPMTDTLIDGIRNYVESRQDGEMLFHTKTYHLMTKQGYKRMWESILYTMNKVAEENINGLTAHIFRHNFCTELCYNIPEISTKSIAKLLGDNEKMVLEVYSHILERKENISSTIKKSLD